MRIFQSTHRFGLFAVAALSGIVLFAAASFGTTPPPIDPTLCPTMPVGSPAPVVATPEQWDTAAAVVLSLDPEVDWVELCEGILYLYDLLPPTDYDPAWEATIPGSPSYVPPTMMPPPPP